MSTDIRQQESRQLHKDKEAGCTSKSRGPSPQRGQWCGVGTMTRDSQGTCGHHTCPRQGAGPRPSQEANGVSKTRGWEQRQRMRSWAETHLLSEGREVPGRFFASFCLPALFQQAVRRPRGFSTPGWAVNMNHWESVEAALHLTPVFDTMSLEIQIWLQVFVHFTDLKCKFRCISQGEV